MTFNSEIYRSYDIRGIVPDEFTPDEAYHIGRAYAQHVGAKSVIVAQDMRPSGNKFAPELKRGLTEGGINVIDIGLASTPLFYFAIHHLQADGGLMVTASHNPAEYNGIKITREKAIPIGGDSGLLDIRDLVQKRDWSNSKKRGIVTQNEKVRAVYLDSVAEGINADGLSLVVDSGNGMAGLLLADLFKRIGGTVTPLYWELDGTFPNHEADPLKEENMADVKESVIKNSADFGVAFDGDGDRVFFVTEKGTTVPGDITTALIATEILRDQPGSTILYDLRSSRATYETIKAAGGNAVMSKVGHSNIKKQMRQTKAVFAGELSGHFYFTPWYAESSLRALMRVIRLLQRSRQPLSALVEPIMKYAKTPEINFTVADKDAVLKRLRDRYSDARILELDGISIQYKDWWANVRASNTEPKLRLNMEADTIKLLAEKKREIEDIIQRL